MAASASRKQLDSEFQKGQRQNTSRTATSLNSSNNILRSGPEMAASVSGEQLDSEFRKGQRQNTSGLRAASAQNGCPGPVRHVTPRVTKMAAERGRGFVPGARLRFGGRMQRHLPSSPVKPDEPKSDSLPPQCPPALASILVKAGTPTFRG